MLIPLVAPRIRARLFGAVVAAVLASGLVGGAVSQAATPMAERLVFHTRGTDVHLYMAAPDGSDLEQLAGSREYRDPAWSPDGTRLAVSRRGDIAIVTVDGSVLSWLTDRDYVPDIQPEWSPDGRQIAWSRARSIWVMNADGTHRRQVTPGRQLAFAPTWSPDGSRIAYHGIAQYSYSTGVYLIDAQGETEPELFASGGDTGIAWSPDGTEIAWGTSANGMGTISIGSVDRSSVREVVPLAPRVGSPAWSPSGSRLAFVKEVEGSASEVFTTSPRGEDTRRVTYTTLNESGIHWQRVPQCTQMGTGADEVFSGTAGDDVICGNGGDDRFVGSDGRDIIFGGLGVDRIDYRTSPVALRADLRVGSAAAAGTAHILSIESVFATQFDDVVFGDDRRNVINGYGGGDGLVGRGGDDTLNGGGDSDVLRPGLGGDDANGGEGRDSVSFFDAAERVRVNLANNFAFGQGEDFLIHIEKIIGSSHDDFILGDDGVNVLKGGDGVDVLDGQAGPDDLYGGDERDYLYGRGGRDTLEGGGGVDELYGGDGADDCASGPVYDSC